MVNFIITLIWNIKSNEQVIEAYDDAKEWIYLCGRSNLNIESIRARAEIRLNNFILPQMQKRGLDEMRKQLA